MKTLALIKRRPDVSRDAFREHYEEVHAPLAIDVLLEGNTVRYVRSHLRDVLFGEPAFDVVTAFWYRDVEQALAVQKKLAEPVGEVILRDELTFMDKPANAFFPVAERPVSGSEAAAARLRVVALVGAPADASAEDFVASYEAGALPRLLEATREPAWCLQNRAVRMGAEDPAFDLVTQVHGDGDAGLADWARGLADAGARVVVAAVSEHESDLPWVRGGA